MVSSSPWMLPSTYVSARFSSNLMYVNQRSPLSPPTDAYDFCYDPIHDKKLD